jgi:hypothetical protein
MYHFSQASAAATCSALSETAQSTAAKIQQVIAAGAVSEDALEQLLSVFSARLQQFRQHLGQLSHCITDASAIHPEMGDVLRAGLDDCQNALSTVSSKLAPGSGGLSIDAIARYETLVKAYLRLFILATQLLTM